MKWKIFTALLFCYVLLVGFSKNNSQADTALALITERFQKGVDRIEDNIEQLVIQAELFDKSKKNEKELKAALEQCRLQYKRQEYLLTYYDAEGIKKYINGAPLPTVEKNVPDLRVIEPVGLQVLDELIHAAQAKDQAAEILILTQKLSKDFFKIKSYQLSIAITHRHVFEAARMEMINIFSLGLTGFDTPGSVNALPEAVEAIKGVASAMEAYYPMLIKKDKAVHDRLRYTLEDAIFVLATSWDFDTFDRLKFLKEQVNPIYKYIRAAQLLLNIETRSESDPRAQPVNEEANNIFSKAFLNKAYFSNQDWSNPQIENRKALGRILFYDPILSQDLSQSCASCHQPDKAFTDGKKKSLTQKGRNTPGLINAVYAEKYFYDIRESNLERQIAHVVYDSLEFHTDFFEIANKLKKSEKYVELFNEAYQEQPQYALSKWAISDALATYIASLVSMETPFDKYVRGEVEDIEESVINGFNLFMGKGACGTCHFAPTFSGLVPPNYLESETEVLGILSDTENLTLDTDLGRRGNKIPLDNTEIYNQSMKTTTVRNVKYTAPYMHNGVYDSLAELIEFYNQGGGAGRGLDVPNQTLPAAALNLSKKEKKDLENFMLSLSDELSKFSPPKQLPRFENNPEWNDRVEN